MIVIVIVIVIAVRAERSRQDQPGHRVRQLTVRVEVAMHVRGHGERLRIAEARVTLGVAAAREGELEEAVAHGELALAGERKSLPSLLMVSRELATIVGREFGKDPQAVDYLEHLNAFGHEVPSPTP